MTDDTSRGVLLIAEPPAESSERLRFYEGISENLARTSTADLSFSFNDSRLRGFDLVVLDFGNIREHSRKMVDDLSSGVSLKGMHRENYYFRGNNVDLEEKLDGRKIIEFPDYGKDSISLVAKSIGQTLENVEDGSKFRDFKKESVIIDLEENYQALFLSKALGINERTVYRWFEQGLLGSDDGRTARGEELLQFLAEYGMHQYLGEKMHKSGEVAKIVRVTPRTVSQKWFDNDMTNDPKYLRGFKFPGSGERMIPERRLNEFLRHYGMIDFLDEPVYTSGQIANFFEINSRVVHGLDAQGILGCYKLPFSTHRRFPHSKVLEYFDGPKGNARYRENFRKNTLQRAD